MLVSWVCYVCAMLCMLCYEQDGYKKETERVSDMPWVMGYVWGVLMHNPSQTNATPKNTNKRNKMRHTVTIKEGKKKKKNSGKRKVQQIKRRKSVTCLFAFPRRGRQLVMCNSSVVHESSGIDK